MIVAVGDTHGRASHRLEGATLEAVSGAEAVVHTGDFITQRVLDGFEELSARLYAVSGNNDSREVGERLPSRLAFEAGGIRIALAHGHERGHTALSLLGREEGADLVVYGHSHRPGVFTDGEVPLLNPGSHADPRGNRPAHAELHAGDGRVRGRFVEPDGTAFGEFSLPL